MDYLSLFYALTLTPEQENYATYMREKSQYVVGDVQKLFDFFLETKESVGHFPSIEEVGFAFNFDVSSCTPEMLRTRYGSTSEAVVILWSQLRREIVTTTIRTLESKASAEPDPAEKRKIYSEIGTLLLSSEYATETPIFEDEDIPFDIDATSISETGTYFPIKQLNEDLGPLAPGHVFTILGGPGSFKTTVALRMVDLNSVERDLNSLYIYLEDSPDQYKKKLVSLYSYRKPVRGARIPKSVLIKGTKDEQTKKLAMDTYEEYNKNRKGKIYYLGMTDMSREPAEFASQLAKIVNEKNISTVYLDYAQCLSAYRPPKYSQYDYLNTFVLSLGAAALGMFNNQKFALVILTQTTKEALKRAESHKGMYTLADGADISALERMSYVYIACYCNDNMKAGGQLQYQLLKARNGETVTHPVMTNLVPEFGFVGDVDQLQNVFNPDAVEQNFDATDFTGDFGETFTL